MCAVIFYHEEYLHRLVKRFNGEYRPTVTGQLAIHIDPVELL